VWDVMSDQDAWDKIKAMDDPAKMSATLLDQSLKLGTRDNLSVMVIKL